jgi:hypothetical protein
MALFQGPELKKPSGRIVGLAPQPEITRNLKM